MNATNNPIHIQEDFKWIINVLEMGATLCQDHKEFLLYYIMHNIYRTYFIFAHLNEQNSA